MSTIHKLTLDDVQTFLSQNNIVVLHVASFSSDKFNQHVYSLFQKNYPGKISFGTINNYPGVDFVVKTRINEFFIKNGLEKNDFIPTGYYLFKNSRIVGYHPGLMVWAKDKNYIFKSGVLSFAFATITQNTDYMNIFSDSFETGPGLRVYAFFNKILQNIFKSEKFYQQHIYNDQKTLFGEETKKAFKILGISFTSNNDQIKKTYRKLVTENHPDKYPDPLLKKKKNEIMVELNRAYELLKKERNII